jgi:hypothetical protein
MTKTSSLQNFILKKEEKKKNRTKGKKKVALGIEPLASAGVRTKKPLGQTPEGTRRAGN